MTKPTKAAKATTTKASAKKFAPITAEINDCGRRYIAESALYALPCVVLKELLRERSINIPKRKEDMIRALAPNLSASMARITITIG